jgi:hypothetical protein
MDINDYRELIRNTLCHKTVKKNITIPRVSLAYKLKNSRFYDDYFYFGKRLQLTGLDASQDLTTHTILLPHPTTTQGHKWGDFLTQGKLHCFPDISRTKVG